MIHSIVISSYSYFVLRSFWQKKHFCRISFDTTRTLVFLVSQPTRGERWTVHQPGHEVYNENLPRQLAVHRCKEDELCLPKWRISTIDDLGFPAREKREKNRQKPLEWGEKGWEYVGVWSFFFFGGGGTFFFVKRRLRIVYWDKWHWVFLLNHTGYVYHVCTTSTKKKSTCWNTVVFPPVKPFEKTNKKRWKTQATNVSMCPLYVVCWSHFGQVHTDSFPTPEEIRVQTIGTVRSPYKERVFRAGMGEGWMYCCCFFPELMGSL